MEYSYSSYQNGASKDTDFQKLYHTIATSIQKISQNGKWFFSFITETLILIDFMYQAVLAVAIGV